ncbi:MAG: type II toxin-antitoxin system HicA family toxin [Planctomycetes bacterium]|nr:type II toxin-antitoxin system HicA family toxin [Planctomycetota bacterium]
MTERPISYRDLAERLRKFGCVEDAARGKGGHRLWVRRLPDGRMARCAVPFHGPGRDVPPGILRSLRRRLGLALPDGVTDREFYEG